MVQVRHIWQFTDTPINTSISTRVFNSTRQISHVTRGYVKQCKARLPFSNVEFLTCSTEVESIVEDVVDTVMAESSSTIHHRVTLISKLVKLLEHDATWVDLYGLTGQLNVPAIEEKEEDDISELLVQAKKVGMLVRVPASSC